MLNCSTVQQVPAASPEKVHFYLEQVSFVQIESLLHFALRWISRVVFQIGPLLFHLERKTTCSHSKLLVQL